MDLRDELSVIIADRKNAIRPSNARKSDVKKILNAAAENIEALVQLWEEHHGKA